MPFNAFANSSLVCVSGIVFEFNRSSQPNPDFSNSMNDKSTFGKGNKKYGHRPASPCQFLAINCFAIGRLCAKRSLCKRIFSSVRPQRQDVSLSGGNPWPPWRQRPRPLPQHAKARRWFCSRPSRPRFNSNASCSPTAPCQGTRAEHLFVRAARAVCPGRARRPLPSGLLAEEGRVMVLRALLMRHEGELKLFRPSARRPGFAQHLGQLLGELQQHQFTPANFALSRAHRLAPRTSRQTPRPGASVRGLYKLARRTRIAGRKPVARCGNGKSQVRSPKPKVRPAVPGPGYFHPPFSILASN